MVGAHIEKVDSTERFEVVQLYKVTGGGDESAGFDPGRSEGGVNSSNKCKTVS